MERPVEETIDSTPTKYLPKDVLTLEFNPSKKLAHFVVELRNEPGALEHSAALATMHKVNILSGFHHAPSASQRAFWSFFADLTESSVDAAGFARELSSLTSTMNVRYNVPPNGLLIDGYHFPVQWGGQRAIMIRTESIGSIFARVNGIFGDGPAARVILFEMGEAAGRAIYKDLEGAIGSKTIRDELSNVLGLYACNGWGIVELLRADFGARTAAIRVTDNFECVQYNGRSAVPRSNFVRGHVAGWFSGMFGTRIEVIERRCIARGDLTCEFVVQPPAVPA